MSAEKPLWAIMGDMAAVIASIPGAKEKLEHIERDQSQRIMRESLEAMDRAVALVLQFQVTGQVAFESDYRYGDGSYYLCPAFDAKTMQPLPRETWRKVYRDPREENRARCEREMKAVIAALCPPKESPRAICGTLYQLQMAVDGVPAQAIICGACEEVWTVEKIRSACEHALDGLCVRIAPQYRTKPAQAFYRWCTERGFLVSSERIS